MILTVSDLLESIKEASLDRIKRETSSITHRPTIGSIFEGLTGDLLNRALFKGLDLRVVQNSFITNDNQDLSGELDCILVVGDGKRILYTNKYIYHEKDVIAVFQVKKKLRGGDIIESYENLRTVIEVATPRKHDPFVSELFQDAYELLTSKPFPNKARKLRFTNKEKSIYYALMMDAFYPLRIVIGYYGYKTEYGFREGFIDQLEKLLENGPRKGFSPLSLPNLFICENHTIVKNNGMPMGIPLSNEEFYWPILTTSSGHAMYHLLELIWTRLSYKFKIAPNIFGDDFDYEPTHQFLSCKEKIVESGISGWEYFYHTLSRKDLSHPSTKKPWEPLEYDSEIQFLISLILENVEIDITKDKNFLRFIEEGNVNVELLLKKLLDSRLFYFDENKLSLSGDKIFLYNAYDGKTYLGYNKSGEFDSYIVKKKFR